MPENLPPPQPSPETERPRTRNITIPSPFIMTVNVPSRWEANDVLAEWSRAEMKADDIASGTYRTPHPIRDRTKPFKF